MPKVAVSAGHNPKAKGACFEGLCEYDIAQIWAVKLGYELELRGVDVYLVPTGSLKSKVSMINAEKCDAALEIHFNAGGNEKTSGCETLYCQGSKRGRLFAQITHDALVSVMHNPDRGIKEGWYRMDRPGVTDYKGDIEGDEKIDYFLLKTNCPAIIVEPEFIQQIDHILCMTNKAVKALADAVASYVRGI